MHLFSLFIAFFVFKVSIGAQLPIWLFDNDALPYPKRPSSRTPVPALYHARYSEQTFIGTHDSAALRTPENGYSLSGNQYFNVSVQLQSGVSEAASAMPHGPRAKARTFRFAFSKHKATEIPMAP